MPSKARRRRAAAPARTTRSAAAFGRLVRIMAVLRSPHGCPWDREQTHATLRPFLLEETYEALDAIDRADREALRGEIGDVLFQCVFHAQIAAEDGRWDAADVIDAIAAKLVRRHPHVFSPSGRPLSPAARRQRGLTKAGAVVEQWEQIKTKERAGQRAVEQGVLSGVPASLPALLGAHEIGTRAAAVGFDWNTPADVVDKIDEEVRELREAVGEGTARVAEEMGDLLFSIANLARKLGVEPESALREANAKFRRRFAGVEARLAKAGRSVHDASTAELEAAWQAVKTADSRTVMTEAMRRVAVRSRSTTPDTGARSKSSRRSTRRRSRA
jgi:MazG family protein